MERWSLNYESEHTLHSFIFFPTPAYSLSLPGKILLQGCNIHTFSLLVVNTLSEWNINT